jgi:protein phosphatase
MNIDMLYRKALEIGFNADEFRNVLKEFKNRLEFDHVLRNKRIIIIAKNINKAVFFGDIHGDIETLYALLKKINIEDLINNQWYIVFLGDYIDRGYQQIETIAFIAMLKNAYPSNIITLRGNHEPYKNLEPYPHDYPNHLVYKFGRDEGLDLYELSRETFDLMPLALYIPSKILAVHGGPPIIRIIKYNNIDDILTLEEDPEAIEDILWSDPIEDESIEYSLSYRGAGKLWGLPITLKTLEKLNIKLIIRGHEPVEGYKLSHKGKVITLFSMKGYYGNTIASCLKLSLDELDNVENNIVHV